MSEENLVFFFLHRSSRAVPTPPYKPKLRNKSVLSQRLWVAVVVAVVAAVAMETIKYRHELARAQSYSTVIGPSHQIDCRPPHFEVYFCQCSQSHMLAFVPCARRSTIFKSAVPSNKKKYEYIRHSNIDTRLFNLWC